MSNAPDKGASAPTTDLSQRLASAATQAIRKTNALHRTIPGRVRSTEFRVTFEDGRQAVYRVNLEIVRELPR